MEGDGEDMVGEVGGWSSNGTRMRMVVKKSDGVCRVVWEKQGVDWNEREEKKVCMDITKGFDKTPLGRRLQKLKVKAHGIQAELANYPMLIW